MLVLSILNFFSNYILNRTYLLEKEKSITAFPLVTGANIF